MLQQAWNFQWTLNHLNRRLTDPETPYIGAANWIMFDHNRGYYAKPNYCGMMDIFRLPKFVYYFYQSQLEVSTTNDAMVYVASHWNEPASKVIVYSNCDEVELFINGRSVGRQSPDNGVDTPYAASRSTAVIVAIFGTPHLHSSVSSTRLES
jgi:beta-galactosidase